MHLPAEGCIEFEIPCRNQDLIKPDSILYIQEKLRYGQMKRFLCICCKGWGVRFFSVRYCLLLNPESSAGLLSQMRPERDSSRTWVQRGYPEFSCSVGLSCKQGASSMELASCLAWDSRNFIVLLLRQRIFHGGFRWSYPEEHGWETRQGKDEWEEQASTPQPCVSSTPAVQDWSYCVKASFQLIPNR